LTYTYYLLQGKDYANNKRSVTSEEFIVDSSPPVDGIILFDGLDRATHYIQDTTIRLRLERFYDNHSGIAHYKVGVGSTPDMADVILLFSHQSNLIDILLASTRIVDGYTYFVIVQVIMTCT